MSQWAEQPGSSGKPRCFVGGGMGKPHLQTEVVQAGRARRHPLPSEDAHRCPSSDGSETVFYPEGRQDLRKTGFLEKLNSDRTHQPQSDSWILRHTRR